MQQGAKPECEWEFMTHLLAILALMSAWSNNITPESSIAHITILSLRLYLFSVYHIVSLFH